MSPAADTNLARESATSAGPFRRVLVAWDGSPDSVTALRTAAAIVGRSPGHVVALSVQAATPHQEAANDQQEQLSAYLRRVEAAFGVTRESIARSSSLRIDLHTSESPSHRGLDL